MKKRVRIHHAPGGCTLGSLVDELPKGKKSLTYQCKSCKRRCCWCNGAADKRPNHCDSCFVKAEKRDAKRKGNRA